MKVFFLLLVGLGLISTLKAQNFEEAFKDEVCDCITNQLDELDDLTLRSCYEKGIYNFREEFVKRSDSINNYSLARDYGRELESRINQRLIKDCVPYLQLMDSLRMSGFRNMDIQEKKQQLQDLKRNSNLSREEELFERGELNFILGRYNKSLRAFKKLLKSDEANQRATRYVGWLYEIKKDYDKALKYYEDALISSQDSVLRDVIMIVEVKKEKKL